VPPFLKMAFVRWSTSSASLREMVRSLLLQVGKEVRDRRKPQARKPRYQFHIENCQKWLSELSEKRR